MTIRAVIFDLDGTLVKTERLKAQSYAKATIELCPYAVTEEQVLEDFKDVVGLSRHEVSDYFVKKYNLADKLEPRLPDLGVKTLWQGFVQIRLRYYEEMLQDPAILRGNLWQHNVNLLKAVRAKQYATALATMSHCIQAQHVLNEVELAGYFDFIATRDDVEHSKPDPEIYNLVSRELGCEAESCLVIEDSPSGVQAALAAHMAVIAVTTPFTRQRIHDEKLLDEAYIVDTPDQLLPAVRHYLDV